MNTGRNWLLVVPLCLAVARACSQCQLCAAASDTYVWSLCEGKHCLSGGNCTSLCASCTNAYSLCSVNYPAVSPCHSSSPVCGSQSLYSDSSGELSVIDSVAPLTLCLWTLDLRDSIQLYSKDYVQVSLTLGTATGLARGLPVVAAYTIFERGYVPEVSKYVPTVYSLDTKAQTVAFVLNIRANYMYFPTRQIAYWAEDSSTLSVGLALQWTSEGESQSNTPGTTSIVTIAAVSMVSTTALFCCLICVYKYLKVRQRRRIYMDRTDVVLLFPDRTSGRPLVEMRPVPQLTKEQISHYIPIQSFQTGVLEIGEPICTVCLEE